MRKIVVAFDHAGVELHDVVVKTVRECGCEVIDVGTDSREGADYPDFAFTGSQLILDKEAEKGIFVCGSGIGMSLAANKIKGIYASVCHDVYSARQSVEHDDINVMCLGSRVIGPEVAREVIIAFLNASFNGKPNQTRRVNKVRAIENGTFELKNNSILLHEYGQSVWLDNIRRGLLKSDALPRQIRHGIIRGITSNPTIFRQAITDSPDYENALTPMALAKEDEEKIFTQLSVEDIRNAADLFRDLYIQSNGNDGFVSLEVSPMIAHDPEKTVTEAKVLWKAVNRPNLMIKIPVIDESYSAITELTAAGINLNLTLLFSPQKYEKAANAYIEGLKQRLANGETVDRIQSVASVFISRIDTKVDAMLAEKGFSARSFLGKTAIRNAQMIYNISRKIFNGETFADIAAHGGNPQRVLWASTGAKNPLYKPTYYVESLIGENTINSVPEATLEALHKTSALKPALPANQKDIDEYFDSLSKTGIDMSDVYAQLEADGIEAFQKDYLLTLDSIRTRSQQIREYLGSLQEAVRNTYTKFEQDAIMRRIFARDPTVWTYETQTFAEIRNRLGWLDTYKNTENQIADFLALRNEIKKEGITNILLLGMGGSSLAPEVIASIFRDIADIRLTILDSTDPNQIEEVQKKHDPGNTLFIVSSKSGSTAEVRAFMNYFYAQAQDKLGENAGRHFIAITDPGTALEKSAKDLNFRQVILSDASVGGRYSALTAFGMLPAILIGLDPEAVTRKVRGMMKACSPSLPSNRNEGAALGGFIGTAAVLGRDKLTILTDKSFSALGAWIEQLIAESSGKEGTGIIPVDLEPEPEEISYAKDRCFVYIDLNGSRMDTVRKIREQGHPVYIISVKTPYDLFAEFYRWEIATATACSVLTVNAFNQPDVQESKTRTAAKISEYHRIGSLKNDLTEIWSDEQVSVYSSEKVDGLSECKSYNDIINNFISKAYGGENYIAVNAYLPRSEEMTARLQKLRSMIQKSTNCATMLGFGPRFLHSTGQLHKGGNNNGLFIQIIADYSTDITIPGEDLSFGVLEQAQALGDFESLCAKNRRAICIRFKNGLPEQD